MRSAVLLNALDPALRARFDTPELESQLATIVETVKRSWPAIALSEERFLEHLAAHLSADVDLLAIKSADLYLACACLERVPAALLAFESTHLSELRGTLLRMQTPQDQVDDAIQTLLRRLLVAEGEGRPRIAQYSGRAELKSWLRVAAVREVVSQQRKLRRERPLDEMLLEASSDPTNLELEHLKQKYRAEFKVAFERALASLESRERNILRYQLVDGLNIDQIATIYGVHRATVARWIARTREDLLSGTRRALVDALKLSDSQVDSIFRLIQSNLDISFQGFLGEDR
jgi:RNA polymerase sigma-70 factor (ECF subfamily)